MAENEMVENEMAENEYNSDILTNIEDSNTFYKLYNEYKKENKITNVLNKYERTKIIFTRINMISNGAIPYISNPEKYNSIYDIVIKELNEKKIPFIIKRNINGNDEYLKLEEFIIL
jgi:DNA-directed RNA polymerase subunit K/omega